MLMAHHGYQLGSMCISVGITSFQVIKLFPKKWNCIGPLTNLNHIDIGKFSSSSQGNMYYVIPYVPWNKKDADKNFLFHKFWWLNVCLTNALHSEVKWSLIISVPTEQCSFVHLSFPDFQYRGLWIFIFFFYFQRCNTCNSFNSHTLWEPLDRKSRYTYNLL